MLNFGWIGIAVACLIAGYLGGCEHKQRELDVYKASVVAAGESQERQTRETIQKHKRIAQETKTDYEKRIVDIRAAYRLRPSSNSGIMPTVPKAAGSADAAASDSLFVEQCAETTQQLVSLQDFIKETR